VDNNVYFANKFNATDHGESGTVRLLSAHIGGRLHFNRATITGDTGPPLVIDNGIVDNNAYFRLDSPPSATASEARCVFEAWSLKVYFG
jgi:hypothetical protein